MVLTYALQEYYSTGTSHIPASDELFITVLTSNRKVHWYTKFQKNHVCYYLNFRYFANAFKYNW